MTAQHTCADHEPELSALLDGQLPEPAAARLRAHLVNCPGCLAELEGLRRARSLLRSLPVRAVPAGLFNQSAIEGRYAGQSMAVALPPKSYASRLLLVVLVGVVVVAMLMMMLAVGTGDRSALVDVGLQELTLQHAQAAGDSGVGGAERLVLEWPQGPDGPVVVSRSNFTSPARPLVVSPVDLSGKYDVVVGPAEQIMDRRCIRMDMRIAATGELREQVWIDQESGVFLRRETYESGQRARTVAYLSLDLDDDSPAQVRPPGVVAVNDVSQFAALRAAGWTVPPQLAGGYLLAATVVHTALPGMPVQAIYSDGLYTVSLFVQPGQPDLTTLPADMEHVPELDDRRAYALPGLPAGIVWGANQHVLALMGDAPHGDLLAIVRDLPGDRPSPLLVRLGRGMHRMVGGLAGD